MTSTRFRLESLVLGVLLNIWLGCGLYLSSQSWLLDIARDPRVDLTSGESIRVPGKSRRPAVLRLTTLELGNGEHRLLEFRVGDGPGFVVQLVDRDSQKVTYSARFPPSMGISKHAMPLDGSLLPSRLRVDVRSRTNGEVVIESASLLELPSYYRALRSLIWWMAPLLVTLFGLRHRDRFVSYFGLSTKQSTVTHTCDRLVAFLIFLVCFLVYRGAPVQQLIDSKFTTAVSHYLIADGTFSLPDEFAPTARRDSTYILQSIGGKTYHFFSDAPSLLNIPFVAAFEQLGIVSVGSDGRFVRENERRMLVFIAAFLAAAICAIQYLTARLWLPPIWALGLVAVFALGTQNFSVLSRAYWSHSWAVLLLSIAVLLLATPRLKSNASTYVLICSLLCWAYFCRPPLSLSIIGVTAFIAYTRRQALVPFLVTGLVWAGVFATYSLANFNSLLPPYFLSSHLSSGRLAGGIVMSSYPTAMAGTLFSPGRGLFVYVPVFLVILVVVIRRWRWIPAPGLATLALSISVAHWQLVSLFRNWWGGQCFGPRLMSDILPWLLVLGTMAIAGVIQAQAVGAFRWTPIKVAVVALTIAASIFVNTRGATARETADGAGIWNWRYPQFLAGLIPRPDTESGSALP